MASESFPDYTADYRDVPNPFPGPARRAPAIVCQSSPRERSAVNVNPFTTAALGRNHRPVLIKVFCSDGVEREGLVFQPLFPERAGDESAVSLMISERTNGVLISLNSDSRVDITSD